MTRFFDRTPSTQRRLTAGLIGGLAGSAAYAVTQTVDIKVFTYNTDDFVLLGSMAPVDDELARPLGIAMHFGNGALLGIAYSLFGRDHLPGSPFVKGMTWTMLETFGLYPLALLENFHPGVRDGRLPSYLTGKGFVQQLLRHVAYGAALGPVTDALLTKK